MQNITIVTNGTLDELFLPEIRKADFIIGVDRAGYWLIQNKVVPDLTVGDFDSVSDRELEMIKNESKKLIIFPKDKDFTDIDLAVSEAVKLRPTSITVYGYTGSRIDHVISSLQLAESYSSHNISIKFIDSHNEIYFVDKGVTLIKDTRLPYLSVIPVSHEITYSTKGCKYETKKLVIRRGQSIGVSNEVVKNHVQITIHQGKALVIRSKD